MKTAISVPDHVFEQAERFARRTGRSRSELFSTAVSQYLASHDTDDVTEAMDRVVASVGLGNDPFATQAGQRTLVDVEW